MDDFGSARIPDALMKPGTSSFAELLRSQSPTLLPSGRAGGHVSSAHDLAPHGTTVLAATYDGGVIIAGDRRATQGNLIAERELRKVYPTSEHSAVAFAGAVGMALELVRLFQTELEHYEKIEGTPLSLEGQASRLSAMVRENLSMAMQGMVVVPLFVGFDHDRGVGRIFGYEVAGGRSEKKTYAGEGSGSPFALGALKKLYRAGLSEAALATILVQALVDAADDDSATGGPDLARRIYPILHVIDADGGRTLSEAEVAAITEGVVAERRQRPDGPLAELD